MSNSDLTSRDCDASTSVCTVMSQYALGEWWYILCNSCSNRVPRKDAAMDRLLSTFAARNSWLDSVSEKITSLAEPLFGEHGPQEIKDVLYGVPLGHPLHPMLTDITIGAWTTSMIMDVLREDEASDVALKIGTASSVATALTGIAQYYDATNDEEPRRIGAAHAGMNVAALGLYVLAIALRNNDHRAAGIATAWMGHSCASVAGWMGGHLSFALGIGVKRGIDTPEIDGWQDTGLTSTDLSDGDLAYVEIDDTPVMVLRKGAELFATTSVCSHLAGPLEEGDLDGAQVTCPWHGSVFDLRDGRVVHGPATVPLTTYDVRLVNGRIEVR